jgi:transcriptional regulator with XRE-family HTH domain
MLRAYRAKTGRNLSDVARTAGICTSMLSQIERGNVSPSIDTLYMVCDALQLDMADLFGRLSQRGPVRIHRRNQRLISESEGARYEQLVVSADSSHPAEMFMLELQPSRQVGLSGQGHEGVEMGHVLSGKATLTVGEGRYQIEAGDTVSFASHLPHKLVNDSHRIFRSIWTVLPPHKDYLEG